MLSVPQILLAMGHAIVPFVQPLFPVYMTSLRDEDNEVRSNTIYGLGLLAFYGGEIILPYPLSFSRFACLPAPYPKKRRLIPEKDGFGEVSWQRCCCVGNTNLHCIGILVVAHLDHFFSICLAAYFLDLFLVIIRPFWKLSW